MEKGSKTYTVLITDKTSPHFGWIAGVFTSEELAARQCKILAIEPSKSIFETEVDKLSGKPQ